MLQLLIAAMTVGATAVPGQTATPPATPAPGPAAAAPATPPAEPSPQGFTYDPQGRRDPFLSLSGRGAESSRNGSSRPAGLAGLAVAEIALKGTVASSRGFVALVQGVDSRTYTVREGEKLLDGVVRAISQDAMVLVQYVNDPLSLEKQREVRKTLRQTEEAK